MYSLHTWKLNESFTVVQIYKEISQEQRYEGPRPETTVEKACGMKIYWHQKAHIIVWTEWILANVLFIT